MHTYENDIENYFRKKLILTVGRGLVQPPVRKSLKKKRAALRRQADVADGENADKAGADKEAEVLEKGEAGTWSGRAGRGRWQ